MLGNWADPELKVLDEEGTAVKENPLFAGDPTVLTVRKRRDLKKVAI